MYVAAVDGIQASQNKKVSNTTDKKQETTSKDTATKETFQEKAVQLELSKSEVIANSNERENDQKEEKQRHEKALAAAHAVLPHSEAKYGIHEETNRVMITLIDKNTKEVIKEVPPEKSLDLLAKSLEIAGVMLDEKL